MRRIFLERNRVGYFIWHPIDCRSNAKFIRQSKEACIEVRDRHRTQRKTAAPAVGHGADELVTQEIKLELDAAAGRRNERRRQSARSDVERRMPTMIDPWGAPQAVFTDDLRP